MSALVGYASSDEDDENSTVELHKAESKLVADRPKSFGPDSQSGKSESLVAAPKSTSVESLHAKKQEPGASTIETNGVRASAPIEHEDSRTAIRNLTLPPVPNLDIPSSPSGTPPPLMTEKVERFLQLKQQGIHFNKKLASSASLKNPSLFGKLSVFAGLEPEDQYATTIPVELWNPRGFPKWAYKDELGKAQEQATKIREQQKTQGLRSGLEFVKAKEDRVNQQSLAQRQQIQQEDNQKLRSGHLEHRNRSRSPDRRRR